MRPLVLDTSAYSRFRAGHSDALRQVETAIYVVVPAIVVGELEMAFELGSKKDENRRPLLEFIDQDFVRVHDVDRYVARIYGSIMSDLRRRGTPIPVNDIWIAATAIAAQGRLLTFDRDFQMILGLDEALTLLS